MRTLILQATLVLVFTWLNGIAVGQTTVTFVDSSGAPVAAVDAVFFNGGFGKPIETKEGIGTVKGSEGVVGTSGPPNRVSDIRFDPGQNKCRSNCCDQKTNC